MPKNKRSNCFLVCLVGKGEKTMVIEEFEVETDAMQGTCYDFSK